MAEQLIVKNLPFIKILPTWAQALSIKYCSKTANLYIAHGNIRDYLPHKMNEDEFTQILQLVRGKELVGEIVVLSSDIAYVQCNSPEGDEYVFECIVETPAVREAAYHFVMSHEYDEGESPSGRRWTH